MIFKSNSKKCAKDVFQNISILNFFIYLFMLHIIIYLIQNEGDESFGGRRRLYDWGWSTAFSVFSVFFFSLKSVLDCSPGRLTYWIYETVQQHQQHSYKWCLHSQQSLKINGSVNFISGLLRNRVINFWSRRIIIYILHFSWLCFKQFKNFLLLIFLWALFVWSFYFE